MSPLPDLELKPEAEPLRRRFVSRSSLFSLFPDVLLHRAFPAVLVSLCWPHGSIFSCVVSQLGTAIMQLSDVPRPAPFIRLPYAASKSSVLCLFSYWADRPSCSDCSAYTLYLHIHIKGFHYLSHSTPNSPHLAYLDDVLQQKDAWNFSSSHGSPAPALSCIISLHVGC
jgi:hypothetical protein